MGNIFWIAVTVIVFVGITVLLIELFGSKNGADTSVYQRRKFLMDSNAEFALFKVLVELYGDKYYIFPQVHYSHLLEAKKMDWKSQRKYMSRLDRKSADFVFCDKVQVAAQLVIELDGPTHARERTQIRDGFINEALKSAGLPVLHLVVGPYTPESIKEEVDRALAVHVA